MVFAWYCSIFITPVYKDCLFCCNPLSLDLYLCLRFQPTYFQKPLYPISYFCILLKYFTCMVLKMSLLSMQCLFPRHCFSFEPVASVTLHLSFKMLFSFTSACRSFLSLSNSDPSFVVFFKSLFFFSTY